MMAGGFRYLGWASWILLLIPIVLFVRIVSRRSRWSIFRMILVSLTGVLTAALWFHYAEIAAGAPLGTFGGELGLRLSGKLESWVGGTGRSFFGNYIPVDYNKS